MKLIFWGAIPLLSIFEVLSRGIPRESKYAAERDALFREATESIYKHHNLDPLSKDEQVVSHYLDRLRQEEWVRVRGGGTCHGGCSALPSHKDQLTDVQQSEVYKVLKNMPKAASLHLHEDHELDKAILLNIVWQSDDFQYLYVLPSGHSAVPWTLDFFIYPPKSNTSQQWQHVSSMAQYTQEAVLRHISFLDILRNDNTAMDYWKDKGENWGLLMEVMAGTTKHVINNVKIKAAYIEALITHNFEHGYQYLETRRNFRPKKLYAIDGDPEYKESHGKRYLSTETEIEVVLQVIDRVKRKLPHVLGLKRIGTTQKYLTNDHVEEDFKHISAVHRQYPAHLVGFDIAGEEDQGRSFFSHIDVFLQMLSGDLDSPKSTFSLFLHAAETNRPLSLLGDNAEDPVSPLENAFDALLLKPKRIGHGLGFIKYPHLLEQLKDNGIALEVCPVSNSLFGYIADPRLHPAVHYIRTGIPVVLSADASGALGTCPTLDWYIALMDWGLSLGELKLLILNSIEHATLEAQEREQLISSWLNWWESFISKVKLQACESSLIAGKPEFIRVFPRVITPSSQVVHIYGRHFDQAFCSPKLCKFGELRPVRAEYVSSGHLVCSITKLFSLDHCTHEDCFENENQVTVSVSIDGGEHFQPTGILLTMQSN